MATPIVPQFQNTQSGKNLTGFTIPQSINENLLSFIQDECLAAVETSPEGQELQALRAALTKDVYAVMGRERGNELEELLARVIILYGERMLGYGLEIGLHPAALFDLPNSPY
jgi:hypothetical protein